MHFETSDAGLGEPAAPRRPRLRRRPGQGGSFAERFRVTSGQADGQDVVLHLDPTQQPAVLSDVSTGPVLFATC